MIDKSILQSEIETYIVWYLPAVLISQLVTILLFFSDGSISFGHRYDLVLVLIKPLVTGFWLFIRSSKYGLNRWLWLVFGLAVDFFAVIFFILLLSNYQVKDRDGHE